MRIASIAPVCSLPPGRDLYDYLIPDDLLLSAGDTVQIIFRGHKMPGVVLSFPNKSTLPSNRLLTVDSVWAGCRLTDYQLSLAQWASDEYHASLGQVFKSIICKPPRDAPPVKLPPLKLNTTKRGHFSIRYIQYHSIDDRNSWLTQKLSALGSTQSALVIFPELALLELALESLPTRLRPRIMTIHGSLPPTERYRLRQRLLSENNWIIFGTPTALFEPIPSGVSIILDDESNQSYKQTDRQPHWHGREVAWQLARLADSPLIFTGFSPTADCFDILRTNKAKWTLARGHQPVPLIESVSFRSESPARRYPFFSEQLFDALTKTINAGQSVLLLCNQRGLTTSYYCLECGWRMVCPNCQRPISVIRQSPLCLFCGQSLPSPEACPHCQSVNLRHTGFDIYSIADQLAKRLPNTSVTVIDKSTRPVPIKASIIIGTSAVFRRRLPPLGLTALLSLDAECNRPDWTAQERAYQILLKLRGLTPIPKRCLCQSIEPTPSLVNFTNGPALSFIGHELQQRTMVGFPPAVQLIKLTLKPSTSQARRVAEQTFHRFTDLKNRPSFILACSPPFESYNQKEKSINLLLKFERQTTAEQRRPLLNELFADWHIDVHPINLD